MRYNIIVAKCNNNGIGYNNKLPWHFKTDMKHFSKTTKGNGNNAIIMGRKTWESLPNIILPGRYNIVLTSQHMELSYSNCKKQSIHNLFFINSIEGINMFCEDMGFDDVWIIGGSSLYTQFITKSYINTLVITFINKIYKCDTFFPDIPSNFKIISICDMNDVDTTVELKLIICKHINTLNYIS